jgi:hypothetical protein
MEQSGRTTSPMSATCWGLKRRTVACNTAAARSIRLQGVATDTVWLRRLHVLVGVALQKRLKQSDRQPVATHSERPAALAR